MKRFVVLIICTVMLITGNSVALAAENPEINADYGLSYALFVNEKKISGSNEDVIYPVGSLSKILTSALTLKLCEENKISLEGNVYEYLPTFSMKDERYKDIKVLNLLNHTSGLMGSSLKNTLLYNDKDRGCHHGFLDILKEQRLKYTPGEMANYCNDGYTLLELLIESVTGLSYEEYLYSVFGAYLPEGSIETMMYPEGYNGEYVNAKGAMGIYSSSEDICRLSYLVTSADEILNKNSRDIMMSLRENALEGEFFGLGWDKVSAYPFDGFGIKALTKGGDTLTCGSAVTVIPESGIVACVIMKGKDSKEAEVFANSLIIDYLNENGRNVGFTPFDKAESADKGKTEDLLKYEGLYINSNEQFLIEIKEDYCIIESLISGSKTKHSYLGNGRFNTDKGYLYFSEVKGETYIVHEGNEKREKGEYRFFDYYAVKKEQGGEIPSEWKERDGRVYLLCDEKYTSMLYMESIPYTRVKFSDKGINYLSYLKITDGKTALCDIKIPGDYGSDLTDICVFDENGKEYIKSSGWVYSSLDDCPTIYSGNKSVCTILDNGYTRWFKTGEANGKKIEVVADGKGMFAVYNEKAECIFSSLRDSFEAVIPAGGYIAFSGEAGTVFEITLA